MSTARGWKLEMTYVMASLHLFLISFLFHSFLCSSLGGFSLDPRSFIDLLSLQTCFSSGRWGCINSLVQISLNVIMIPFPIKMPLSNIRFSLFHIVSQIFFLLSSTRRIETNLIMIPRANALERRMLSLERMKKEALLGIIGSIRY